MGGGVGGAGGAFDAGVDRGTEWWCVMGKSLLEPAVGDGMGVSPFTLLNGVLPEIAGDCSRLW